MPLKFEGPIPGENFTSDTKNYPWHRPPEMTDMDEIIEYSGTKLMSEESSVGLLTMIKNGVDVSTLTDIFVTSGIGAGKWSVDMGILAAGPISHIICLLADAYEIDYDLGIDDKIKGLPSAYFKAFNASPIDKTKAKVAAKSVDIETVKTNQGFMSMGEQV